MTHATNLSRPIVEALYSEALVLADEVRAVFARAPHEPEIGDDTMSRLALSTEGLKTTTRVMHILAWLLNQRAFFSGELSEQQVRLHGTLPADRPADEKALAVLEPATRDLIAESEQLHKRIARLDAAWRSGFEMASPARAIHSRLERRLSDLKI
jgi:regulator of CtrA degradation